MITWLIWIAFRCPRKVSRFNNSLTHPLLFNECHFYLRPPLVPMGIVVISCIPNVPNGITALTLKISAIGLKFVWIIHITMKQIANWLLCTAIFASFMELWSFHDRLWTGVVDNGAALILQRFEPEIWWDDAHYHHADCYIQWLCSFIFVHPLDFQHFPWQAWIKSEGSWLILANVRKSDYSLKFGGMMKCTMKRITIWNGHAFSDLGPPRVLLFSECRMVIRRMITYPNIVFSIMIF